MALFYLGIFATSLLLSFIFTKYVRDMSNRRGWLSMPFLERHLHRSPLPRLGGVAIVLSFLLTLAIVTIVGGIQRWVRLEHPLSAILTILLPGLAVFALGVYDDIRGVGPYTKFGVQALAAAALFAGGLRILDLPVFFGGRHFPWFASLPLTILWVLAITNAFNLIDGLDGLAAGSALFSTVVVFVVALVSHSSLVSLMTLALAGAILGFLRYNFNPATIFLGDSGSLFIGFLLSALALKGAQKSTTIIAVAIPVVSFGLPILETSLSVLRRFISGRPVFTADREHIHHKLLQLGLSHRQAVIILYAVSALFALLSLFLLLPTGSTLALVLVILGVGVWFGVQRLNYLEFGELRRVAQRTMEQRQIFINNLSIRRATQELQVARNCDQLGRILSAAFDTNTFDAFELRLHRSPQNFINFSGLQFATPLGEEPTLRWRKSGSPFAHSLAGAWSLKVDLLTSSNFHCGSMTFYRLYTARDLQLDINLLTAGFPIALADALQRTALQEPEPVAEILSQKPTLVAAQAS